MFLLTNVMIFSMLIKPIEHSSYFLCDRIDNILFNGIPVSISIDKPNVNEAIPIQNILIDENKKNEIKIDEDIIDKKIIVKQDLLTKTKSKSEDKEVSSLFITLNEEDNIEVEEVLINKNSKKAPAS